MASKKGFEIQFNWLFILIAGAAIILFFSTIIIKQKDAAKSTTNAEILKSFEAVISGASASLDTTNIIDLPESEINVRCGSISAGTVSRQFLNLIIFSPNRLKGSKIITQTYSFNLPFRTSNMLMVTSPFVKYVIVGNDDVASFVNKSMPDDVRKETYDQLSNLRNTNEYKVKLVFSNLDVGQFPPSLLKMNDLDVSAVKIIGDLDKGALEFYSKKENIWEKTKDSYYIGNSIFGAIYSDHNLYTCSMDNVIKKSLVVTQVYKGRTVNLVGESPDCDLVYGDALGQFDSILNANFDAANVNLISSTIDSIKDTNKEAQKYSCASIY